MATRIPIHAFQRPICKAFLTFTLLLSVSLSSWSASLSGQVFAVISGDRIIVFDYGTEYRKVKLHGIHSPAPDTPAGRIARRHLHMLLAGKFVTVNYQSITPQGDIDGTVLHGGSDVNLRMLEAGMARISDLTSTPEILQRYQSAERRAQERGQGIWKGN